MHTKSVLTAIAMLMLAGGYSAYAAPNDASAEIAALDAVTVSAADAVAAVEAKGTGKVVEFALLNDGTSAVYQVTTLTPDGTETNYAVDARTGAVATTVDINQDGESDQAKGDDHGSEQADRGEGDGEAHDDGEGGEDSN